MDTPTPSTPPTVSQTPSIFIPSTTLTSSSAVTAPESQISGQIATTDGSSADASLLSSSLVVSQRFPSASLSLASSNPQVFQSASNTEPGLTITNVPVVAAASHKSINGGAVAGGVIGAILLLILILVAVIFRKSLAKRWQHLRNRRIAPSAEFLSTPPQPFPNQSRLGRSSPGPGLLVSHHHRLGNSRFSVQDLHYPAITDEEAPPPFTPGTFNDPVIEKVNAAARQREIFLQTHAPSLIDKKAPYADSGGSSLYNPYESKNPFEEPSLYPLDNIDIPATSPILSTEDYDTFAGQSSGHGHQSPRSTEAGVGWAA